MIQKPSKIETFDDLNKVLQDWFNNLSISDLKAGDLRTAIPTADQIDKTRYTIVEVPGGVPTIVYRDTNGNRYKWEGTLIS